MKASLLWLISVAACLALASLVVASDAKSEVAESNVEAFEENINQSENHLIGAPSSLSKDCITSTPHELKSRGNLCLRMFEAALVATESLNQRSNSVNQLELVAVESATSQIVAGVAFNIKFKTGLSKDCKNDGSRPMYVGSSKSEECAVEEKSITSHTATVWWQAWETPQFKVTRLDEGPEPVDLDLQNDGVQNRGRNYMTAHNRELSESTLGVAMFALVLCVAAVGIVVFRRQQLAGYAPLRRY